MYCRCLQRPGTVVRLDFAINAAVYPDSVAAWHSQHHYSATAAEARRSSAAHLDSAAAVHRDSAAATSLHPDSSAAAHPDSGTAVNPDNVGAAYPLYSCSCLLG